MKALKVLGIIAMLILVTVGGFIAWWASQTSAYTHRFRLVIEAEVDGALRSGASVIEVRTVDYKSGLPHTTGVRSQAYGEAVFVDLGNGRHVIATLGFGPHGNEHKIERLARLAFQPGRPPLEVEDIPKLTGTAPLVGDLIPTLVTFTDLNDPKTARVLRPDEFETVFGPGVRFKRAWIEMTSEPVTRGIEQKLAFLQPMREAQKGKSVLVYPDRLNIVPLLFVRD